MKCQNPACGKFFVKLRNNSRFCSVACQTAEYNQRRNARQREQTAACRAKSEPYKPVPKKYKSPISDREQRAHDMAIRAKYAIEPGPVKHLRPGDPEFDEIAAQCIPPSEQRSVSALYGLCSVKQARWC